MVPDAPIITFDVVLAEGAHSVLVATIQARASADMCGMRSRWSGAPRPGGSGAESTGEEAGWREIRHGRALFHGNRRAAGPLSAATMCARLSGVSCGSCTVCFVDGAVAPVVRRVTGDRGGGVWCPGVCQVVVSRVARRRAAPPARRGAGRPGGGSV